MSNTILHVPANGTVPEQTPKETLASATEKLAALRFFILLTARREALEGVDHEAREQIESDLVWLRSQYSDMIDEIAMRYGVQQAMDAKRDVDHQVTVPREWPPLNIHETEQAWF